jgi:hypothetical protein
MSLGLVRLNPSANTGNVRGGTILTASANSSRFLRFGRLLLVFLAFSGFALADGITIVATGVDPNRSIWGVWVDENGTPQSEVAGVINITLTEGTNVQTRDTLCVDLFTNIYLNETYNDTIYMPSAITATSDTGQNLEEVSWLLDNTMVPSNGMSYAGVLTGSELADMVTTPAQGAGLQLAIWDLTVDNGDGFSAGQVQASNVPGESTDPTVLYWAETYESLLKQFSPNNWSDDANVYVNWSVSGSTVTPAQMLEGPVFQDNGPKQVAPEPATFVLVGTALIAIGWSWRRQIRKPHPCRA